MKIGLLSIESITFFNPDGSVDVEIKFSDFNQQDTTKNKLDDEDNTGGVLAYV